MTARSLCTSAIGLVVAATTVGCTSSTGTTSPTEQWSLILEQEFNGEDGTPPDPNVWQFDVGGDGWGNNQEEYNTPAEAGNVIQYNGCLQINAKREQYQDFENQYTSGRITTKGLFEQTYGRFEARIQVPPGAGLWPAFWMLGATFPETDWPLCGEMDVMEWLGRNPTAAFGSLHGPNYSGADSFSRETELPEGTLDGWEDEFCMGTCEATDTTSNTDRFSARMFNDIPGSRSVLMQANKGDCVIQPGDRITINFAAKGSELNNGNAFAEFYSESDGDGPVGPNDGILGGGPLELTNEFQDFSFTVTAGEDVSAGVTLLFLTETDEAEGSTFELFVDDVSMAIESGAEDDAERLPVLPFEIANNGGVEGGGSFAEGFHVYRMDWDPGTIRFLVDGELYQTRSTSEIVLEGPWVFDQDFFILLNLAVGGNLGGPVDNSIFPASMLIDYVHVYERAK